MSERNQELDSLKGFTILLVMLGHCIVLNGMQDGIIYDAIKAIQMPLFMIISGYITGMTSQNRKDPVEILGKIRKRAIAYLVPFFAWIVILHTRHLTEELVNTLFQLDRGLWFLVTLFLLTTVMYLAILVRENTILQKAGFALVWGLAFAGLLFQILSHNTFLSPHLTIYYLPFFVIGYLLYRIEKGEGGRIFDKIAYVILKRRNQIIVGTAALIVFVYLIVSYDMIVANDKKQLLCQIIASMLGCYLCVLFVKLLPFRKVKKYLGLVGNYTLEIYVIHYHFATILGLQNRKLVLYSAKGACCILVTFLIMSLLTSASIWLCKRFWITDLLLFGKMKVKK